MNKKTYKRSSKRISKRISKRTSKRTSKRISKRSIKRRSQHNRRIKHNKTHKGGFFYNRCAKDLNPDNITSLEEAHSIYQNCCPSTNLGFMKIKNKTSVCRKLYKRANEIVKQENDNIENPVMDVNAYATMPQPTPDSNNMVEPNSDEVVPVEELPDVYMYDRTQPGPSTLSKVKGYFSK